MEELETKTDLTIEQVKNSFCFEFLNYLNC